MNDPDHASVGQRLKFIRKQLRLSQEALAKRLGTSQATIARWEAGRSAPASSELAGLALMGVDPAWMVTGQGVAPEGFDVLPPAPRDTNDLLVSADDVVRVPLLAARLGAGPGDQADDARAGTYPLHAEDAAALGHPRVHLRAARVRGDSMAPLLHDGDTVVVVRDPEARDGVCVIVLGGEVMVKRVQWARGGGMRIVSENPAYPAIDVGPDDDVRVIGRVVMRLQRGMR